MRFECYNTNPDCKYFETGCFQDKDHYWWPRSDYKKPVEKEFRNLPEYQEYKCRDEHDERHATEDPPPKPDLNFMREAIRRYKDETLSKRNA